MSFINASNNLFREQKVVNSAGDYVVLDDDVNVNITNTAIPRIVVLPSPSSSNVGKSFTIKDTSGGAATNNIVISAASGNIDNIGTYVINQDYGFASFYSDGSNYFIFGLPSPPANATPVRVYLGSDWSSTTHNTHEPIGLSVTIPAAGIYRLKYNLWGEIRNIGAGSLESRGRLFNTTAGSQIGNSSRAISSISESVGINSTCGGTCEFDVRVAISSATTFEIQARKLTIDGTPITTYPHTVFAGSYIEYRSDQF